MTALLARPVRLLAVALWLFASLAQGAVEIGQPAPPLKGLLVSGDTFDLADYRGKVVIVNFYSSYCRHCALEIGSIETAVETYGPKGLVVIMLGVDQLTDKGRVARMLGIYNLQGGMVDELTECGFGKRYPTPTAFVIDREGVVREKFWGVKTQPRIRDLLAPYFNP